jgi:hypothetical protein
MLKRKNKSKRKKKGNVIKRGKNTFRKKVERETLNYVEEREY